MAQIMTRDPAPSILATELSNIQKTTSVPLEDGKVKTMINTDLSTFNRIFFVGILSEVTQSEDDSQYVKAKVSCKTGVYSINAGQYEPDAASFLLEQADNLPVMVAVVAKVKMYEPEPEKMFAIVRPETITLSDIETRDYWIQDATNTIEMKLADPSVPEDVRARYMEEITEIKSSMGDSFSAPSTPVGSDVSSTPTAPETPAVPATPPVSETPVAPPTPATPPVSETPAVPPAPSAPEAPVAPPTPEAPVNTTIPPTPSASEASAVDPSYIPENSPSGLTEIEDQVLTRICEYAKTSNGMISAALIAKDLSLDRINLEIILNKLAQQKVIQIPTPGFIQPLTSFENSTNMC